MVYKIMHSNYGTIVGGLLKVHDIHVKLICVLEDSRLVS